MIIHECYIRLIGLHKTIEKETDYIGGNKFLYEKHYKSAEESYNDCTSCKEIVIYFKLINPYNKSIVDNNVRYKIVLQLHYNYGGYTGNRKNLIELLSKKYDIYNLDECIKALDKYIPEDEG